MQLRRLSTDDDAMSPVVGTVLLVGIVVASMAIISSMVLGTPFERTPDADLVYSESPDGNVTIAVASVDGLTESNTEVRLQGGHTCDVWDGSDDIEVGDAVTVSECDGNDLEEGKTIQIIWSSGSQSALIDSYEVSG